MMLFYYIQMQFECYGFCVDVDDMTAEMKW